MQADDAGLLAMVGDFLAQGRIASLATVDERGLPHAANVYYVHRSRPLCLWFVSSPESAHSRHIARDGHAAMTIHAETADPNRIHGLQCHGTCARVESAGDRMVAWELYLARYPFVAEPELRRRIESEAFYGFVPTWLRWIDNRVRFGFKVEASVCEELP